MSNKSTSWKKHKSDKNIVTTVSAFDEYRSSPLPNVTMCISKSTTSIDSLEPAVYWLYWLEISGSMNLKIDDSSFETAPASLKEAKERCELMLESLRTALN